MSETTEASVCGVIASWLTPSCLFLFINLVIATIAITTKRKHQHKLLRSPSLLERLASFNLCYYKHEPTTITLGDVVDPVENLDSARLDRIGSSSSLLDRVRSFDLDDTERPDSVQNSSSSELDKVPFSSPLDQIKSSNLKSEIEGPDLVQMPDSPQLTRVPSLLDQVRSFNLGFNKAAKTEIKESDLVQQQLTRAPSILQRLRSSLSFERSVSFKKAQSESGADGELTEQREEEKGVDAKADDFINRFRQQLRLQRLDSIMRYRDMLKRN